MRCGARNPSLMLHSSQCAPCNGQGGAERHRPDLADQGQLHRHPGRGLLLELGAAVRIERGNAVLSALLAVVCLAHAPTRAWARAAKQRNVARRPLMSWCLNWQVHWNNEPCRGRPVQVACRRSHQRQNAPAVHPAHRQPFVCGSVYGSNTGVNPGWNPSHQNSVAYPAALIQRVSRSYCTRVAPSVA